MAEELDGARRVAPAMLWSYLADYVGYRQSGVGTGSAPWTTVPVPDLGDHPRRPDDDHQAPRSGPVPEQLRRPARWLHTAPAMIEHDGRRSGAQVALHPPLSTRALLGVPPGELAGVDLPLGAVLGTATVSSLRARLLGEPSWQCRSAVVDELFERRLGTGVGVGAVVGTAEVGEAWRLPRTAGGAVQIRDLAGCPPSQWLAEELRSLQGGSAEAARDWPS